MTAWLIAGGDAIQKDVESALASGQSYKRLSLDEKLTLYLRLATERMAMALGLSFAQLRPWLTDYIGLSASIYEPHHSMDVAKKAAMLGLSGIELHSVDLGGASIPHALGLAQKLCLQEERLVLIAAAEVPRGGPVGIQHYREVNDELLEKNTELHTHANLIALYALLADRMRYEHGITKDDIVAITQYYRSCAIQNERAANFGKALSAKDLERYLAGCYATPMVAVATDHGAAFLVASDAMRERLEKAGAKIENPLALVTTASSFAGKSLTERRDFTSPAKAAARRAFARAGIAPHEIDYAWIYDCFTLMLVRQAADYFKLDPKETALTLREGFIRCAGKKIPVNAKGGILNTQAAIALSAASGLMDILEYRTEHPEAENFLFGGNGGIDSINTVAILSRKPRTALPLEFEPSEELIPCRPPEEGELLSLYAAAMVYFNPGTKVPFALGALRRADGTLLLAHLADRDGKIPEETDSFPRDVPAFRLSKKQGVIAQLVS
ncbi:MAG: hypothetical protein N2Z22_01375 [Turneriella sp.]|nr:hypothetical protein [Turneriella sp.]